VDGDATIRFYTEGLGCSVRHEFLGGEPPAEVRIAFVTGPNGEVIEFLKSEQL
jgi:hypothetical protein